jgi:hypothetical protein
VRAHPTVALEGGYGVALEGRLPVSESGPIRVFPRDGRWLVDYGSYVCAYCATRSEAITAGTEAARIEYRELMIEDAPAAGVVVSFLRASVDQSDPEAFAEYVRGRIPSVSSQLLAGFLEDFDPDTATDEDVERGALLADLANAAHDPVSLAEHEEAQLDRLIATQPRESREMYTEVRNTNARHVLCMLRGLERAKVAGTYTESPSPASSG